MKKLPLYLISFLLLAISLAACTGSQVTTQLNTSTLTNTVAATVAPSPDVLAEQGFENPQISRVTAWQLNQMLENNEQLVIIDTRDDFFYGLGHIPEAVNIDWHPETLDVDRLLELPKDSQLVFYCD